MRLMISGINKEKWMPTGLFLVKLTKALLSEVPDFIRGLFGGATKWSREKDLRMFP